MVPNQQPTVSAPYRIAIIGDLPTKDEVKPFTGYGSRILNGLLSKSGIMREACYIGNVCQTPNEKGNLALYDWFGTEIQTGIDNLTAELTQWKPNVVLCLGGASLHLFKEGNEAPNKGKDRYGPKFSFPNSIDSWRGTRFIASSPRIYKCLATYHPLHCFRNYETMPMLALDLNRLKTEGLTSELFVPPRNIRVGETVEEILLFLSLLKVEKPLVSVDIEGYYHNISCISFSRSASEAFVIPFSLKSGDSRWLVDDEVTILAALSQVLNDPSVPKIWQNGMYDRWCLQYGYGIPVLGNQDDTMLRWWEKYCELEKGLAIQCSILTDTPYYKGDRKSNDDATFFRYNGMDTCITYEINEKLEKIVADHSPRSAEHYQFNSQFLNALLYCELRGIVYDKKEARLRASLLETYVNGLQAELDKQTGQGFTGHELPSYRTDKVRAVMCFKKDPSKVKKGFLDVYDRAMTIADQLAPSATDLGWLNTVLDIGMNIKGQVFKRYLYDKKSEGGLGLPEQYNKDSGAVTTDGLTLLKLAKAHPHPTLDLAIDIADCRTRMQMLQMEVDDDGRIRCGYNVVGTVTGRITSYKSPTDSGYNLQTIPDDDNSRPPEHPLARGMRDLFKADTGHYFFQCDLKGSDGWTIGAHLNRLGAPTMLEDLRNGIKPAERIAYMLRHGITSLRGKGVDETRELLKEVKKTDWDYFALKIGIWGMAYGMGPDLLADVIFEQSDGKIKMTRKQVEEFRRTVMEGYSIPLWHNWATRQINSRPELTSASGNKRHFYGRPGDILNGFLSHEPQHNTTYAIKLATMRLWNDPENRQGTHPPSPFIIEPLHTVHDSLNGQWPKEYTPWAIGKLKEWFNNPLIIAGQSIVIPTSITYGNSWGEQDYNV